ncbi:MAG: GerMN domain-containing protein [Bacillota bacterium]|nr:GerMN domain-containing protein [Bacillota bacterium]
MSYGVFVLTAALLLSLVSGCVLAGGVSSLFRRPAPGLPGDGLGPITPNPDGTPVKLTLYFGDTQALSLMREERTVVQRGESAEELAVWELIKGPAQEGHVRTVPKETRLLSLQVVEGIAYVNFAREIQTRHPGGTTGEMFTVQAIVNTLIDNNPQIKKVQFLLEGKVEDSIWGHGITSEPIGPVRDMIAK